MRRTVSRCRILDSTVLPGSHATTREAGKRQLPRRQDAQATDLYRSFHISFAERLCALTNRSMIQAREPIFDAVGLIFNGRLC